MRRFSNIFVLCFLLFATLACGSSTTEQFEEAVAREVKSEIDVTEESEPEPTEEPTNEPDPTEIPPTDEPESTNTPEPTDTPEPTSTPEPTEVPPTPTPEPEPISIVSEGFGQDDRSVAYSFIVENPNAGLAFENSQYQVAAFDESGAILETDSGYITLLFPDQILGIAGSMYLDEGMIISDIEVQLNAGDEESMDSVPDFIIDSETFILGDYSSSATAIIQNPFEISISNLRVYAIAYDADDNIVGGGSSFVNFVPENGSTGIKTSLTSTEDVERVELYSAISSLSLLDVDDEIPSDGTIMTLESQGYGQDDNNVGYGFIIENPNELYSLEDSQYRVTFYGEEGHVIDTENGYVNFTFPKETLAIAGSIYVDDGQVVDRVEAQIQSGEFVEASEELLSFSSENVTFNEGSYSSDVTGFIVNPYTKDVTDLKVSAVAYDDSGEIIGGGSSYLDFAAANGKSAVEVSVNVSETPASVELYATISSLTEFE